MWLAAPRDRNALVPLILGVLLMAALAPSSVDSHSTGIVGQTRNGCTCHNVTEALSVEASLRGLPGAYEPGRVYDLNISFEGGPAAVGSAAGFNLAVSAGTLLVPSGPGSVRVDPSTGDATHTLEGSNTTWWRVRWRAPGKDTGDVTLTLVVNAVNGDLVQDPNDQWGRATTVVEEGNKGGIDDAPLFWSVIGVSVVIALVALAYLTVKGPRVDLRR